MGVSKKQILISPVALPEYRVGFYNKLNEDPSLDITIAHGNISVPIFVSKHKKCFKEISLVNNEVKLLGFNFCWQSGILKIGLNKSYGTVVVQGNFATLSTFLLLLLRRFLKRRNMVWMCAYERPEINGWRKKIRNFVSRIVLRFCDGALAYNSYAKKYLIEHGIQAKKITVLGNTNDVVSLNRMIVRLNEHKCREELKIEKHSLLFIGKLTEEKRIDLLLDALFELTNVRSRKDVELILLGDGPVRGELFEQARKIRVENHVRFEGAVIEGKEKYLKAATLAVMPGSGGLFINDCMAAKVPIIVSFSDGSHYDLIQNGETGILFNRGDKKDLADKIEMLLANPALRNRIAENAERFILNNYSIDRMAANFIHALKDL